MREILFKAKRKNWKELPKEQWWVIGVPMKIENKNMMLLEDNDNLLRVHYTDNEMWCAEVYAVEIEIDTICRYTGLTDKNGNKIWENDVAHLYGQDTMNKYDWKAVVEFGNPNSLYSWGYQLKPIGHFEYNTDILCWVCMEEANIYCEVIGNIFDDKELLEN